MTMKDERHTVTDRLVVKLGPVRLGVGHSALSTLRGSPNGQQVVTRIIDLSRASGATAFTVIPNGSWSMSAGTLLPDRIPYPKTDEARLDTTLIVSGLLVGPSPVPKSP